MLIPRDKCTGCGICSLVCGKKCIKLITDEEGFIYPQVNSTECISCGICEKSCPVINVPDIYKETELFAVKNNNDYKRYISSSGGVFCAMAEYILSKGGIICGAGYDENFRVKHYFVRSIKELPILFGAKYSQSCAHHLFPQIHKYLIDGQVILFVGTPCQIAGLKNYLRIDYDNLITVDMVCHGVPSPYVWQKYLAERRSLDADFSEIKSVNQRSKKTGWSKYSYSVEIVYSNNFTYNRIQHEDWFMKGFVNNLYLRPSCSNCSFKGINRCSDFTLGDCWGIWNLDPDFDDNKGVSLLLIHSNAGKKLWKEIAHDFEIREVLAKDMISYNPSLVVSSPKHINRNRFFKQLSKVSLVSQLIKKNLTPRKESWVKRIGNKLF